MKRIILFLVMLFFCVVLCADSDDSFLLDPEDYYENELSEMVQAVGHLSHIIADKEEIIELKDKEIADHKKTIDSLREKVNNNPLASIAVPVGITIVVILFVLPEEDQEYKKKSNQK